MYDMYVCIACPVHGGRVCPLLLSRRNTVRRRKNWYYSSVHLSSHKHNLPLSWMSPCISSRLCDPLAGYHKAGEGRRAAPDELQDMSWVDVQWINQANRTEMWIPRVVSCCSMGCLWAWCFVLRRQFCFRRGDTQHRLPIETCFVYRYWIGQVVYCQSCGLFRLFKTRLVSCHLMFASLLRALRCGRPAEVIEWKKLHNTH